MLRLVFVSMCCSNLEARTSEPRLHLSHTVHRTIKTINQSINQYNQRATQCLALLDHLAEWWLTQHRDLALKLPKIRRYAVNLVRVAPGDPEPAYDGVAELWFDKEEDLFAAYKTDIGKAVAEDSLARVVSFVCRGGGLL